jgi:rubrerythrin
MGQSQFEQIVGFAIDKERESIVFYEDLARRVQQPAFKEVVLAMADEERKHEKLLKGLSPKSLDLRAPAERQDIRLSDYIVDVEPSKDLNYQELLIIAMKREEKAYALYGRLEVLAADDVTRKVFALLRGEELRHKSRLESEYEQHVLWEG